MRWRDATRSSAFITASHAACGTRGRPRKASECTLRYASTHPPSHLQRPYWALLTGAAVASKKEAVKRLAPLKLALRTTDCWKATPFRFLPGCKDSVQIHMSTSRPKVMACGGSEAAIKVMAVREREVRKRRLD